METLVVQVGDLVLYREIGWKELFREKNTLKKYFRYSPEIKTWIFDVARFDHTNGTVDEIAEYLSVLFRTSKEEIKAALIDAVKKQRDKLEKDSKKVVLELLGKEQFAVKPTKMLDDRQREFARTFFTYRDGFYFLDEKKVVDYVIEMDLLPEDKLLRAIKVVMDECRFKYYKEHLEWLSKNVRKIHEKAVRTFEEMNTLVLNDTGDDVELVIKRKLTSEEIRKLLDAFTTVYYTLDQSGTSIEHRMRVVKYDRVEKTYRIPYFAVSHLYRVAKDLKFRKIVDNVRWVRGRIPKPPKFEISLYDFQKEALKAWIRAGCRGTVVVPTGGGKTYIGMAALYYMSIPTLICVTTIELARQWKQKLKEHLGIDAGILGGGHHDVRDVTVAIYNSAVNYVNDIKDKFDFIIFDEVHHVPAESFRKIAFLCKARKRLGLSATPQRYDRNEALIFFSVGNVVYKARYDEMVKLKLASPLKYYRFYVRLSPEEEAEYVKELNKSESRNKIQKLMKIAFSAKQKYELLKKIVGKLPDDKILVFCQFVDQAEKAYKAVREVAKRQAALLTGSTNAKQRKRYFEEFKSGKKRILVTTSVLDEGIDVPDAETAIILSGSGTERQMIQRIGRVIRYRPGKVAKVIEIITRNTVEERIAERRSKVLKEYGIELNKNNLGG